MATRKKITKLTPQQEALFPATLRYCRALGYCTDPVLRWYLEPLYEKAYKKLQAIGAKMEPFQGVLWVKSLHGGCLVWAVLTEHGIEPARKLMGILDSLTELDTTQGINAFLRDCKVPELKKATLSECLKHRSLGNLELHWIAKLSVGEIIIGGYDDKEAAAQLALMRELTHGHSWWVAPNGWIIACERPAEIHTDVQGRISNNNGKAIKYADGWGVYQIEGISVDRKVVEHPDQITIQEVESQSNLATRRVWLLQYGVLRYLRDTGAKLLDSRGGDGTGRPMERLYHDTRNDQKWLICRDGSTNAIHHVFVPREVTTISQAQAALCGLPEELMRERS